MKLKNYTVLSVFVLFLTLLMLHPSATEQTQCQELQSIDEIKNLIEIKGPTVEDPDGEKIRRLAEKIHADFQNLCRTFEDGEKGFEKEMINILGKKTSIKTSEGEIIRYPDTKKYFYNKKYDPEGGHDIVQFELNKVYVFYEEKRPFLGLGTEYDYIGYKIFTIHWIRLSAGKIIENQDDEGEGSDRHTHGCDWIGN